MFYFMYFGKFISLIYSVRIRESGLKNGELMRDCKGKELSVGDRVVFIRGKNSSASLDTGNITKFYKNCYGEDECSVGSQSHILSFRIMKLEK